MGSEASSTASVSDRKEEARMSSPTFDVPAFFTSSEPYLESNSIVVRLNTHSVTFTDRQPDFGGFLNAFTQHEYAYYISQINDHFDEYRDCARRHQEMLITGDYETDETGFVAIVREMGAALEEAFHKVKVALAHWNENSFHENGYHWNCRQFSWFDGVGLRKSTRVPELVITPWGLNNHRLTKLSSVQDRLIKLHEYHDNGMVTTRQFDACKTALRQQQKNSRRKTSHLK